MSVRRFVILLLVLLLVVVVVVVGGVWWLGKPNASRSPAGIPAGTGGVTVAPTTPDSPTAPRDDTSDPAVTPGGASDPTTGSGDASGSVVDETGGMGYEQAIQIPKGGEFETVEGGRMRLPADMDGKEWTGVLTDALTTVRDYVSTAMAMREDYPTPYAGYREALRKKLVSKHLYDELTRNPVSTPDQKDWETMVKSGLRVDAVVDEDTIRLDYETAPAWNKIVLDTYARLVTVDVNKSETVRVDEGFYRFTLTRPSREARFVVTGFDLAD